MGSNKDEKNKKNIKKESNKKEKKFSKKRILVIIILICTIILIVGLSIFLYIKLRNSENNTPTNEENIIINQNIISNHSSIDNELLVLKSLSEKDKYIEFEFEDNILKKIRTEEKFLDTEKYNNTLEFYKLSDNTKILSENEETLEIIIEKEPQESDKDSTYEEILNKYTVKFIGEYEKL